VAFSDSVLLPEPRRRQEQAWLQTLYSVHPSRHTVAKIGLHLIEKKANYTPPWAAAGANRTRRPIAKTAEKRARGGVKTAAKTREGSTGQREARVGGRGAAAKADRRAAVPDTAAKAMEAEVAAMRGVAATANMENTTQATTVAREVATSIPDTPAGRRKATAAVIAGGRTAAVMTAGDIPTERNPPAWLK
jgi:hypothetical protein